MANKALWVFRYKDLLFSPVLTLNAQHILTSNSPKYLLCNSATMAAVNEVLNAYSVYCM